jgi:predicted metal-dependent enzyme (double-stranded beta helix superfamily)
MRAYTIGDLVSDLEDITANYSDARNILSRAAPLAKRVREDQSWVKPAFYECGKEQGFGITVLHEGEGHKLLVEAIAWLPGRGVLPHDHQTWGIVVGIEGVETNVNWLRNDDGGKPGFADLTAAHELRVGPGDVAVFMPDDIHSVRNDSDKTTLSLHIYGKSLTRIDRSEFDPDANIVRACPKREKSVEA